jgi:sugar/nucleoside kinase (ribokinase family)
MPASVHVLGVVALDMYLYVPMIPGRDEKTFATRTEYHPGGPASFVARAAAGLGADVMLQTAVGADSEGDKLIAVFDAAGIRTDTILRLPNERTPIALLMIDSSGEKSIVIVPVGEDLLLRYGAQSHYDPGAVLVTHLFHPQPVKLAADKVRAAGGISLLDLEWPEADRWGWDAAMDAARDIDVICTNAQMLAARFGDASLESARSFAWELAADRKAACVTLGAEGVVVSAEGRIVHFPALRLKADNTTGAGDTFIATLAIALADGRRPIHAAALANCAAGWFLMGRAIDLRSLEAAIAEHAPADQARVN